MTLTTTRIAFFLMVYYVSMTMVISNCYAAPAAMAAKPSVSKPTSNKTDDGLFNKNKNLPCTTPLSTTALSAMNLFDAPECTSKNKDFPYCIPASGDSKKSYCSKLKSYGKNIDGAFKKGKEGINTVGKVISKVIPEQAKETVKKGAGEAEKIGLPVVAPVLEAGGKVIDAGLKATEEAANAVSKAAEGVTNAASKAAEGLLSKLVGR